MTMVNLKCRPSEAEKDPMLVFMTAPQMLNLKLKNGELCHVSIDQKHTITAVAWLTSKSDLKDGVIGISKVWQERANIKLGNEVTVSKAEEVLESADTVPFSVIGDDTDTDEKQFWETAASITLRDNYKYVTPGQKVTVGVSKRKREFEVSASKDGIIYKVTDATRVRIGYELITGTIPHPILNFSRIGGLEDQKRKVRRLLQRLSNSRFRKGFCPAGSGAQGLLLYGAMGTGKSLLRKSIESEHEWSKVVEWDPAFKNRIPLENTLIHAEFTSGLGVNEAKTLAKAFQLGSSSSLIVGEIQDPNQLPTFLRTSNTFAAEIEIPIPDIQQRQSILSILSNGNLSKDIQEEMASKTHGYVGDDLRRLLIQLNDDICEEEDESGSTRVLSSDVTNGVAIVQPSLQHLQHAMTQVRPSALQQVFLEKPNVKWSDIGGQEVFKTRLRNAVEWPLRYPRELKEYGTTPKKGILLYGPPGCSKTMLVKALATESEYNFLAVKGAELISMYVGESERATREIFRKARAASPCIIFFDEIDAIARRAQGSSELNVLTTLLNEMDGFEELKNVLVVAATNKPQSIDPALMRPGRFDNTVYIGPPDETTRLAILRECFNRAPKFGQEVRDKILIYANMTEGMSGAEVVATCQAAGELAFASRDLRDIAPVHMEVAIRTTPRSITQKMITEYEEWNAERATGS